MGAAPTDAEQISPEHKNVTAAPVLKLSEQELSAEPRRDEANVNLLQSGIPVNLMQSEARGSDSKKCCSSERLVFEGVV